MQGWILYSKKQDQIDSEKDYGVTRLLAAAGEKGISLKVYTPNQLELVISRDDSRSILVDGKATKIPDFIIPRLGSATTYFAFAIIRQLEHLGVYSCNSADAVECVRDKLRVHQILAHSNLPTPNTILFKHPIDVDLVEREIGLPVIVKNVVGTEGAGIYLSKTRSSFYDLLEMIHSHNKYANVILQEFIKASSGRDLRVFVLGGRVIGCMKRSSKDGFKANFSRGGDVEIFELSPTIEWLATETARLLGLDIAGIDLLFDDEDNFWICEANSAPGFKGLEKAIGGDVAAQILDYITIRLGAQK